MYRTTSSSLAWLHGLKITSDSFEFVGIGSDGRTSTYTSIASSYDLGQHTLFLECPDSETNIFFVSNVIVATATADEYVGNENGQKLLSTINTSDVITKYGESSKVSHLVTYGAPGYRVGSNIETAYGISEENGTITQHGSCSLSSAQDASALVAWETPDTKLTDVNGLKIGWQV